VPVPGRPHPDFGQDASRGHVGGVAPRADFTQAELVESEPHQGLGGLGGVPVPPPGPGRDVADLGLPVSGIGFGELDGADQVTAGEASSAP